MFYRGDSGSNAVYVYDGRGTNEPLHVFNKLHTKPVAIIKVSLCALSRRLSFTKKLKR